MITCRYVSKEEEKRKDAKRMPIGCQKDANDNGNIVGDYWEKTGKTEQNL